MKKLLASGFVAASLAAAAYGQDVEKPAPWEGELQQEVYGQRARSALEEAVESYTRLTAGKDG
ncbi:MAG TPA: hypothetical protein VJB16_03730, partial [archaeon]|nr:hypothetical protein [archaeon]